MLRRRLAVGFVLLVVLGGLFVHHGATEDDHAQYPTDEQLDADYDRYVGQEAVLSGRVVAIDPANGTLTIVQRRTDLLGEVTVTGVDRAVDPGGSVQVYGRFRPGKRLAASNVVVVNASAGTEWYKYGASVVGAALILVAFFRSWRVDADRLAFEVRGDG